MSTGLYSGVSGLALGVGLYKGVPGLWGGASGLITGDGSSLSLDFLTSNTLDPRVTFSRTTNATLVDSTGRVTYAPNNLVTNSEAFDNASWGKNNLSVSANTSVAPNGTATADKLIPNTTIGGHQASAGVGTVSAGNLYVFSVYAKADGYNFIRLSFGNAAGGGVAFFNVLTGAIATTTGMLNTAIESVGNGWFRCSALRAAGSTASFGGDVYAQSADNQFNWAGNGTDGVLAWGAQLEQVTYQTLPSTYNSTSPPNLFGFTEEFNNAYWTKAGATISPDATAAPNGSTTADKLVEDSSTGQHRFYGTAASTTNTGSYTVSFFAKAAERTRVYVGVAESPTFVRQGNAVFDLSAGTVVSANAGSGGASGGSATIQDAGNGWYRCSYTLILGGANTSIFVDFNLVSTGVTISYTGNGTSGLFLWGAQLSNSASVDPYVYNPGAAPTSTAYYGPRFDYNPVTLAPNGLLIEEQRVNLVLYSDQFNNAPSWQNIFVTVTANTTTSPDGTANADTITADGTVNTHSLNASDAVGAKTISVFVKAGTGNFFQIAVGGTADPYANFNLSAATSAAFGTGTTASITAFNNGWYRCVMTTTNAAATGLRFAIVSSISSARLEAFASSATILLWGAQSETGAFATSYIPTVASTVTRAADIASMTGTNFSSWYNQSEGTIIPQFVAITNGVSSTGGSAFPFVYEIDSSAASTSNHQLALSAGYGPGWNEGTSVLGVSQVSFQDAMTLGNANVRKIAYAYRTNDFAGCANGGTVLTDTSGTLPSPDRMSIGSQNVSGSNVFTGYIRTLTYYPSRLSDAQLRALTA